jgi:KDO2-lipid IV(A) lauroyltransferase
MKKFKYFLQFILIIFLFGFYKLIGLKFSSKISAYLMLIIGPLFRSKKIAIDNLNRAFPNLDSDKKKKILKKMWINYGKIFSEYVFIKNFKLSKKYSQKIIIENQNILNEIKINNEPVIFVSGHFNNFELMAMQIEKSGIDVAAVYRPLNNFFLNPLMEKIRKKYICKKQVKKGISGTKELLKYFNKKTSIALMIDQRVSQGVKSKLFNEKAFTTTIPAQFVKKFDAKVVPIYIERQKNECFKIIIYKPIQFEKEDTISSITLYLNKCLEKMILKNPDQWIWTHNRWK